MSIELALNLPEFTEEYEAYKMRQFVSEMERLHAALTQDVDEEGETGSLQPVSIVGAVQYDMIYNADGTLWEDTAGLLQWNPDAQYMQLAFDHAINWLDSQGTSNTFINLSGGGAGWSGWPTTISEDPDFNSVQLLLNFNGTDGSTSTVDSSNNAHTVTLNSGAVLDEAQFASTPTSLDNRATDAYTSVPSAAGLQLAGDDFTIEGWYYFDAATRNDTSDPATHRGVFASKWTNAGTREWAWGWRPNLGSGHRLYFTYSTNATNGVDIDFGEYAPVNGEWTHFAITRSGNSWRMFVNGVQYGTTQSTGSIVMASTSSPVYVGCYVQNGVTVYEEFPGWYDSFRLTKGVARYTADFTPPSLTGESEGFSLGNISFGTELLGTYVGLKNNIGINWDNAAGDNVELAVLDNTAIVQQGNLIVQLDFEDGSEGGTTTTNTGSAADPTFTANGDISAAAASSGVFGADIVGAGTSIAPMSIGDNGLTDPFGIENNDYTIAFNYYPRETAGDAYPLEAWRSGNFGDWNFNYVGGTLSFKIQSTSYLQATGINVNTWYHVAFTKEGNTGRLFIDGDLKQTADLSAASYPALDATSVNAGRFHTEYIDNILLVKNQAIWTANFTPPTSPDVGVNESFILGDPSYPTAIDGTQVDIAGPTTIGNDLLVNGGTFSITDPIDTDEAQMYWASDTFFILDGTASKTINAATFSEAVLNKTTLAGGGTLRMVEQAAQGFADTAAYGQLWVKNDVPNTLWFTDDAGVSSEIGRLAFANVWTDDQTVEGVFKIGDPIDTDEAQMYWSADTFYILDGTTSKTLNMATFAQVEVSDLKFLTGSIDYDGTNYIEVTRNTAGSLGFDFFNSASVRQGLLYADGSGAFGLLDNTGNWKVQLPSNGTDLNLFGNISTSGGTFDFDTDTGTHPVYFTRLGSSAEALSVYVNDNDAVFTYDQDETTGTKNILFNFNLSANTDAHAVEFRYNDAARHVFYTDNARSGYYQLGGVHRIYDDSLSRYMVLSSAGSASTISTSTGNINLSPAGDIALSSGTDLYIDGDVVGHFTAVSGSYGSVQVSGADGSNSGWAGYNIDGKAVFMQSETTEHFGLYDDANNRWALQWNSANATANEQLELHAGGSARFITQVNTLTGNTSGAQVKDHAGTYYDVGFNLLPPKDINASTTLVAEHCGKYNRKTTSTARTLTLEANTSTDFPVSGVTTVINSVTSATGGNYTVNQGSGTTLYWLDGVTRTAGNRTIGPGGVMTILRADAATYYCWGSGIS